MCTGTSFRQKVRPQRSQWKCVCRSSSSPACEHRHSSYLTLSDPSWMMCIRPPALNRARVRDITDLSTVSSASPISAIERGWSAAPIARIISILAAVGLMPASRSNSSSIVHLLFPANLLNLQFSCTESTLPLHP